MSTNTTQISLTRNEQVPVSQTATWSSSAVALPA